MYKHAKGLIKRQFTEPPQKNPLPPQVMPSGAGSEAHFCLCILFCYIPWPLAQLGCNLKKNLLLLSATFIGLWVVLGHLPVAAESFPTVELAPKLFFLSSSCWEHASSVDWHHTYRPAQEIQVLTAANFATHNPLKTMEWCVDGVIILVYNALSTNGI